MRHGCAAVVPGSNLKFLALHLLGRQTGAPGRRGSGLGSPMTSGLSQHRPSRPGSSGSLSGPWPWPSTSTTTASRSPAWPGWPRTTRPPSARPARSAGGTPGPTRPSAAGPPGCRPGFATATAAPAAGGVRPGWSTLARHSPSCRWGTAGLQCQAPAAEHAERRWWATVSSQLSKQVPGVGPTSRGPQRACRPRSATWTPPWPRCTSCRWSSSWPPATSSPAASGPPATATAPARSLAGLPRR